MIKLGQTFGLGVSLGFAAFQASVQSNELATRAVVEALNHLDVLNGNQVQIDPMRLQNVLNSGVISQSVIEDIRDNDYVNALANIDSTLLSAYQLGIAISGVEGQSTTHDNGSRPIIVSDVDDTIRFANELINGTPSVPLDLTGFPDNLRNIDGNTERFDDLHNEFEFLRGKSTGVLDVTPDPF